MREKRNIFFIFSPLVCPVHSAKNSNKNSIMPAVQARITHLNLIKCWILVKGENRSTRGKTSRSRVENQQTQHTYDIRSRNRTWATLVEGQCSHHCANTAPLSISTIATLNMTRRTLLVYSWNLGFSVFNFSLFLDCLEVKML